MKHLKPFIALLIINTISACQNTSYGDVDTSIDSVAIHEIEQDDTPASLIIDTINESEQNENDLTLLTGKTFYALLLTPNSDTCKYIEPPCLSDGPSIRFHNDEIVLACGQDAVGYKLKLTTRKDQNFSFDLGNSLLLDIEYVKNESFDFINVKLNNMDELFMGYYPDSIVSTNSDRIQMVLWTTETRETLNKEGRYTTLECPDDVFD